MAVDENLDGQCEGWPTDENDNIHSRSAATDGRLDEIRAIAEYAMGRSHAYSRSRVVAALREMIERHDRYREALTEITESRESFGDDRLYANHAERIAHNAINRSAS